MQKGNEERFIKRLTEALRNVKKNKIDVVAEVYHLILQEEDRAAAFQYFLENIEDIESAENQEMDVLFAKGNMEKITRDCTRFAEGILDKIIGKRLDQDEFYRELWEKGIEKNEFLSGDEEKIYVLYCIWLDGRIPYFKLETGILMENDRFSEIVKSKEDAIKKLIFIFNSDFSQRTEWGSHLIKILESCETEDEKAVIMAQILSLSEHKAYKEFMSRLQRKQLSNL